MELQCKERVDLLEALKKSREEAAEEARTASSGALGTLASRQVSGSSMYDNSYGAAIGKGTIPAISYDSIARPPNLPNRPAPPAQRPSAASIRPSLLKPNSRQNSSQNVTKLSPAPQIPVPEKKRVSRTPSPDKKGGMASRTLRPQRKSQGSSSSVKVTPRGKPQPAASGAATQAWAGLMRTESGQPVQDSARNSIGSLDHLHITSPSRDSFGRGSNGVQHSDGGVAGARRSLEMQRPVSDSRGRPPTHSYLDATSHLGRVSAIKSSENLGSSSGLQKASSAPEPPLQAAQQVSTPKQLDPPPVISYRKEYARPNQIDASAAIEMARRVHGRPMGPQSPSEEYGSDQDNHRIHRKAVKSPPAPPPKPPAHRYTASSGDEYTSSSADLAPVTARAPRPAVALSKQTQQQTSQRPFTPPSDSPSEVEEPSSDQMWRDRVAALLKKLPRGVDEGAAKQILNEIVIQGDEVHWNDVAGLDIAKTALKENVVYPFLRPDLFSGLREPARGMLLFGPPGTGKTMLARAVATESRSTFFAISASSLTSKFLGESEKLVRALFTLAKELAPSIIFVDEIDSLLSSRSGEGEHEATRRIKTEFLIQWSDLQRAAAGRESGSGDASRVLVLAATNLPWAIDEAARRRFVRRQYIPLPEPHVRASQIKTLLSHQKHSLKESDINRLVTLTEGKLTDSPLLNLMEVHC